MLGNDTSSLTTLASLNGTGVRFGSVTMTQLNFSAKDGSGNTWSVPNGVTGEYTLNNFDLYMGALTKDQMKEYALSAVPEPAAPRSTAGIGAPARPPPQLKPGKEPPFRQRNPGIACPEQCGRSIVPQNSKIRNAFSRTTPGQAGTRFPAY